MHVYSELKKAQLENAAADLTPASTGLTYINTSGAFGVAKYYDGSRWSVFGSQLEQLASDPTGVEGRVYFNTVTHQQRIYANGTWITAGTTGIFANGNSGATMTIDWSKGPTQSVVLSNNCVFTFANGQPGKACNLIVIQDQTVPYFFKLPAAIHFKHLQVIQPLLPPKSQTAMGFIYSAGVMVANLNIPGPYAATPTVPAGSVNAIAISPDGTMVAMADGTTPFAHLYSLIDSPAGPILGQRAANPATLPTGAAQGVAWSPNGDYLAFAHTTTPFVSVYPIIRGTLAFGAKIANPGTLPAGNGTAVKFTPLGDAIIVGCATTPFVISYPFSSGVFGTAHTAPVATPSGAVDAIDFMPMHRNTLLTDTFVCFGTAVTPFIQAYAYTAAAGIGTISTAPVTLPAGAAGLGGSVKYSPQGDYVAIACASNPFVAVYPFSSTGVFGVKVADPATVPAGAGNGIAWTPDGDFLIVAHSTTPFNSWYPFVHTSGGSFGIKLTDNATLPPAAATSVDIAPNGETVIFGSGTTPFLKIYGGVRNAKDYLFLIQ